MRFFTIRTVLANRLLNPTIAYPSTRRRRPRSVLRFRSSGPAVSRAGRANPARGRRPRTLVVFVRRRDDDGVDGVVQLVVFVVDVNVVPSGKARSSFGGDVHSTGQRDAEFHESLGVVLADVSQPDDTSFDICSVRCHFPVILELPSFVSHQSDTPCGAISNILARRTSVRCQTRHGDQLELGESRLGTESSAEPIVSLPFQLDGNPRAVVRFPVSYGLPSVSSGHPRPAMGWAGTR